MAAGEFYIAGELSTEYQLVYPPYKQDGDSPYSICQLQATIRQDLTEFFNQKLMKLQNRTGDLYQILLAHYE